MTRKHFIALVFAVFVSMQIVLVTFVHTLYKRDMRRFYKDGFRVGRVVGRDDIMLHLKRPDCFTQKLDAIVQDQDAPLIKALEANIPNEAQGKK